VESALEGEITDHLSYDRYDIAGPDGGDSRNGHRSKTVLTEVRPVQIDVPRDRDGSFEPKIVAKRKRPVRDRRAGDLTVGQEPDHR
jgi:putative transposase